MLVVIAEASNPVLTPTICAAPRVIVRQVIPRGAAGAVILADGAPLPLGHIRSPLPPVSLARFVVGQALSFGGRVRRRFGGWSLWHVRLCLVQDLGAAVTAGLVPLVGEEVSSASDIVDDRNVGNWTRSLEKTRSRIQRLGVSNGFRQVVWRNREESVYCPLVQYAEEGVIVSFMTVSLQPLIVHSFLQRLVRAS